METIVLSAGFSLLSSRIPFRRNQDVILIRKDCGDAGDVVGVVDGWNDPRKVPSDQPGREAASFVAGRYSELFLASQEQEPTLVHAAQQAAEQLDREFLDRYPEQVASVGVFAFCSRKQTAIVSIGTIHAWIWNGTEWHKPAEIRDCFLPQPEYESGSRTFWGRGELKGDPFYSLQADALALPPQTPFLMATDGLDDVLALGEINALEEKSPPSFPGFFEALAKKVLASKKQRDDITLLMRWKP